MTMISKWTLSAGRVLGRRPWATSMNARLNPCRALGGHVKHQRSEWVAWRVLLACLHGASQRKLGNGLLLGL